jgi:hypothetical protein
MKESKSVPNPHSIPRASRGSHTQRAATRHRGVGVGARGGKKETPSSQESEPSHGRGGRGGRGGLRTRGSDNWTRHPASSSQAIGK